MIYFLIFLILNWLPCFGKILFFTKSPLLKIFPKNINGFTFGRFVFLRESNPSDRLKKHESIHVKQYRYYGVFLFLLVYYTEMLYFFIKTGDINKAYRMIHFEADAYSSD